MAEVLHPGLGNIIYIYEILKKYSDNEHILSVTQISNLIKQEYQRSVEERTIKRNIRVLVEVLDIDISLFTENRKGYFLRTRDFEMSEIKMLIDLVTYSKFMENNFSKDIVDRLKQMLSKYEKEIVDNIENYELYSKNTKTINIEVLRNIEVLAQSIKAKKKVEFDYYKYNLDKKLEKQIKHRVSPYAILCENEFYYLIAHNERYDDYSFFRLDRIKNVKHTDIPIKKQKQSIKDYVESSVYMYGGEREEVELKCHISVIDHIIDKFGKDTKIRENR